MITTEWGTFDDELSPSEAIMWNGDDQARLRSSGPLLLTLDAPPDWERLVSTFDRLSSLFPRFRQRIVSTPFGLRRPRWVVDPDFDLTYHLRRIALPPPSTFDQVLGYAAHEATTGFDRLRPPWVGTVIEGLEDGRAALVLRVHHVLFDGRGMMQVFEHCFDRDRDPLTPAPVEPPAAERVTEVDLLRLALQPRRLLADAGRLSGIVAAATRSKLRPRQLVGSAAGLGRSVAAVAKPATGAPSPMLRARSNAVSLAMIDLPLDGLRRGAKAAGGSLNDALLASVAGALGQYHDRLGAPVDSANLAFPISIRTTDDPLGGNHFGGATIAAPTGGDLRSRVPQIAKAVLDARDLAGPDVLGALTAVLHRLPSWLLASIPLMDNIDAQVSNFPGLPYRHFIAGSEVIGAYGFGPHPGTPMMIVLISHNGTCCVAVNADSAAVADGPLFVDCLRAELKAVVALGVSDQSPATGRSRRRSAS